VSLAQLGWGVLRRHGLVRPSSTLRCQTSWPR